MADKNVPIGYDGIKKRFTDLGSDQYAEGVVVLSALPAGTSNIGDVDVLSIAAGDNNIGNVDLASAIPAGSALIGKVGIDQTTDATTNRVVAGGRIVRVQQTPTITAGAYAALDAVGGLLTFANFGRTNVGTGILHLLTIADNSGQNAALELVLFDRTFTNTADNAPFDPSDADMVNCLGVIPISSADYSAFADNGVATLKGVNFPFVLNGTSLFGQLRLPAGSAPTYVAVNDLVISAVALQD